MTNPDSQSPADAREPKGSAAQPEQRVSKTPSTDMQADDAGTGDSGVESGSGTAVDAAMKQTSKTDAESGSQR